MIQLGLTHEVVTWIMARVCNAHFVVLVNGSPSGFFKGSRGLCQGCPLSPLLFLLVIKGFSQLILKAKHEGHLKGIKITEIHHMTHLLFVDNVLLFGLGSQAEWYV